MKCIIPVIVIRFLVYTPATAAAFKNFPSVVGFPQSRNERELRVTSRRFRERIYSTRRTLTHWWQIGTVLYFCFCFFFYKFRYKSSKLELEFLRRNSGEIRTPRSWSHDETVIRVRTLSSSVFVFLVISDPFLTKGCAKTTFCRRFVSVTIRWKRVCHVYVSYYLIFIKTCLNNVLSSPPPAVA